MDRLRYLLDSYAGGNCTQEEIQELQELLQDDWAGIRLSQQATGVDWEKMYKELMVSIEGENMRGVTWVVVEEVRSGDWGIGGQPLSTEGVKALAAGTPA